MNAWVAARFERSDPLDGLKGLACILIFLASYPLAFGLWVTPADTTETLARYLASLGRTGVELGFVLFGFWLYRRICRPSLRVASLWATQARRALPTYWVALAASVIVARAIASTPALQTVAANALVVPGWLNEPALVPGVGALTSALAVLLALPLVARVFRLRQAPRDVRRYAIAGAGTALLAASCVGADVLPGLFFVVGFLLADRQERAEAEGADGANVGNWSGFVALGVGVPVAYLIAEGHEAFGLSESPWLAELLRTLWMSAVLFAVVRGATHPSTYLARCLTLRPLRWLGAMSFSWYVLHGLVLAVLVEGFAPGGSPVGGEAVYWLLLPVTFAVTLVLGGVLYIKVERRPEASPVDENVPDGIPTVPASGVLRATPVES